MLIRRLVVLAGVAGLAGSGIASLAYPTVAGAATGGGVC